jgi:hypothetical protein
VDLETLMVVRGRTYSLIDRHARCKVSKCRRTGFFIAATGPNDRFTILTSKIVEPSWLIGATPNDLEPPPPVPPCPPGIDAVRWAYATPHERKRMVKEARG